MSAPHRRIFLVVIITLTSFVVYVAIFHRLLPCVDSGYYCTGDYYTCSNYYGYYYSASVQAVTDDDT